MSFFSVILKVGSLFATDNSDPKIIFSIFLLNFCQLFWCNLKVSSLFASDNFDSKYFFDFFSRFFSIFCVPYETIKEQFQ